ncbi:sugar ABC transporter permease [Pseudoponticoccus marisrubri]|uniref:Xylose transport system permease protein XylH n=1 Tax=Pseudoponticoccus marisrubri TaxID=1685382 RepID=A0A0W7WNF4_9RHOB|nr:sugar ABC transporter permease [Pseudoponticoccus marisrubri]KUF12125.1 sugar ABC transporter permease [Pseudoponticoccus marisrubri]
MDEVATKPRDGLGHRLRTAASASQIDTRLLAMLGAVAAIWIFFQIASGGIFLSPRNIYNLSVQTSVTAILATGMVLIIVSRNIDLSVGSLLAFLGILGGFVQTELLPLEGTHSWWISMVVMVAVGCAAGGAQGWLIARFAIPAFVVTLGGLMFWRGAGWLFTKGRTVTPLDSTYSVVGGGSIGETWSWIVGLIGFGAITAITLWNRRRRKALDFGVKPMALDVAIIAAAGVLIAAFVMTMNAYTFPRSEAGRGIPVPVLILIVVACVMIYVANMTRFGRYIYGYGGNPEAAQLAGVNTRRVVIASFALIGGLTALGAMISTARLNAAPLSIGQLLELQVIAAAVIGGTSLSGGVGTIVGALIGAVLMQSLQNGMVLLGVQSAPQQMIMAGVLIFAVWFDVIYQKRRV